MSGVGKESRILHEGCTVATEFTSSGKSLSLTSDVALQVVNTLYTLFYNILFFLTIMRLNI